jgi:hypothetical protein
MVTGEAVCQCVIKAVANVRRGINIRNCGSYIEFLHGLILTYDDNREMVGIKIYAR